MEFLSTAFDNINSFILLVPVPLIIFSATPRMPLWYRSGRILFMWAIILIISSTLGFLIFSLDEEIPCCLSREYVVMKRLGGLFSLIVFTNIYIGFWEFSWRCIYRQWTWPLLKNLQYGLVSNLCILGAAIPTLGFLALLAFLHLYYHYHMIFNPERFS